MKNIHPPVGHPVRYSAFIPPIPVPNSYCRIHMRIQMTETAAKLGSTRPKAVGNYHLQAKRIASKASDSIQ